MLGWGLSRFRVWPVLMDFRELDSEARHLLHHEVSREGIMAVAWAVDRLQLLPVQPGTGKGPRWGVPAAACMSQVSCLIFLHC